MTVLEDVDALYAGCATEPHRWTDQAFADWSESALATADLDKEVARYLRRIVNAARRIAAFWGSDDDPAAAADDWRSRVDIALGARAWRPQLDLALHLLDRDGDEASFTFAAALFPVVMHQPFLDGIDYTTWRDDPTWRSPRGSIGS